MGVGDHLLFFLQLIGRVFVSAGSSHAVGTKNTHNNPIRHIRVMICFQRFESIKKLRNTQRLVDLPMNNADLRPGVAAINTWAVVRLHPVVLVQLVQLVELQVASTSYIPAVEDLYIIQAEDLYIILLAEDLYIILLAEDLYIILLVEDLCILLAEDLCILLVEE